MVQLQYEMNATSGEYLSEIDIEEERFFGVGDLNAIGLL